jgi:hypothetical protein
MTGWMDGRVTWKTTMMSLTICNGDFAIDDRLLGGWVFVNKM